MAENKNVGVLKTVLIIYAVVCLVYGIGYLFIPNSLVHLSGGQPVFNGWLRWSGGVLIALGTGAILVYLNPQNQGIFVTAMALGCLLIGVALLWAWITIKEGSKPWFTALPTILAFLLAILLWWGRTKAKEILYPKKD
jgi:peptidoglycan/LPS O-acetylase OafA/YrhL